MLVRLSIPLIFIAQCFLLAFVELTRKLTLGQTQKWIPNNERIPGQIATVGKIITSIMPIENIIL